jgi:4-amino-4-deoxy-L-arabinose transferase-like glycosyltransferase
MTKDNRFAHFWQRRNVASALRQPTVRARSDENVRPGRGLAWSLAANWLLLSLIAVQAALVILMAVGRPLEVWDSWVNWAMKARIIFLDGYISPAVYADPSRAITHLDYPLMVPLMEAWFFSWLGTPDDRLAGVPSVLYYLSLVTICYAAVRARGGGQTGALLAATVVATMSLLAGLAGIVFAEMPLVLFTAIASLYLLKWLEGGSAGALLIASLGAGLTLWTKKEGVLLISALCVAALATNFAKRRAWQGVGALGLGAALIAGPWWAFTALNNIVNKSFLHITLDTFQANIGRLPTIAQLEQNSLLNASWSYIWPLAGIVAVLTLFGRKRRHPPAGTLLLVTALLYIPLAGLIYVFSDFVPYEQHVLSSIDRVLAPIAPLLVVWVALQMNAPSLDPILTPDP